MAHKHIVWRRGGQSRATVYSDDTHRQYTLDNVDKFSPFWEETSDASGMMYFHPIKTETEEPRKDDIFDADTYNDANMTALFGQGQTVGVWSPPQSS